MKLNKHDILFWLGIVLAIWFAFAGVFWVLLLALVYGYPAALLSLFCWTSIRKDKRSRNKFIPIILGVGLMLSIAFLALYYFNGEQKAKEAAAAEQQTTKQNPLPQGDNSRVSLDWNGNYEGTLPCIDCDSVVTTLQLNLNSTYSKQETFYTSNGGKKTFTEKGTIEWDSSGNAISLNTGQGKTTFLVGENMLYASMHQGVAIAKDDMEKYALRKK
jgi:uncharacterized lipoprotein NlpE involved in copper resistance